MALQPPHTDSIIGGIAVPENPGLVEQLYRDRARAAFELWGAWNIGHATRGYLLAERQLFLDCQRRFRMLAREYRDDRPLYDGACLRYAANKNEALGSPLKDRALKRKVSGWADHAWRHPARFTRQACVKGGRRSGLARRRKSEPLRDQAIELAAQGLSCRTIGAQLGVGKSTAHRWTKDLHIAPLKAHFVEVSHELSLDTAYNNEYRAVALWNSPQDLEEDDEPWPIFPREPNFELWDRSLLEKNTSWDTSTAGE